MSGRGDEEAGRRRRQSVVAGHSANEHLARRLAGDDDPRVRASALAALARMGRLAPDRLVSAFSDPDPYVRRRASELSARMPDADPSQLLSDPEPLVVESAAWSLGEQGREESADALAAVACGHPDPLCREAAVAALGAIGARAGLGAVLAGLQDRPQVRRRAVVALAAFEGPEVDAALEGALRDRDWQVRQVAEDLVDPRRRP